MIMSSEYFLLFPVSTHMFFFLQENTHVNESTDIYMYHLSYTRR